MICDKPLTTAVEDALALAQLVRKTGLVFGVTHNYTGYPMIRQAREMVAAGELGKLRIVQVEYAQDWLTTAVEATGQKQAAWRTDPRARAPAGSLGDIGTHAYNLACFVSGFTPSRSPRKLTIFVPGRRLDDNVQMMLRYEGGARGLLWASQVAAGNENNLRLRIYGEKGRHRVAPGRTEHAALRRIRQASANRHPRWTSSHRSRQARQPHSLRPSRGLPRSLCSDLHRHRRTNRRARSQALALEAIAARAHRR